MIGVFTRKIKFHLTVIWVDHARELINLNNMAGAGGPNEAHSFVLLLITVYMRVVFFRWRNRFQQRLRLLALRGRRRVMEAYFYHPRRKICRRRKVAWVLERPQFWFENMVLNQHADTIRQEHFQISRHTFQFVCNLVGPHFVRQDRSFAGGTRVVFPIWRPWWMTTSCFPLVGINCQLA